MDEVHPMVFDESMKFGSSEEEGTKKEDSMILGRKAFDNILLSEVSQYTGVAPRLKIKELRSPRSRTPEPEKNAAPRPVFRWVHYLS